MRLRLAKVPGIFHTFLNVLEHVFSYQVSRPRGCIFLISGIGRDWSGLVGIPRVPGLVGIPRDSPGSGIGRDSPGLPGIGRDSPGCSGPKPRSVSLETILLGPASPLPGIPRDAPDPLERVFSCQGFGIGLTDVIFPI